MDIPPPRPVPVLLSPPLRDRDRRRADEEVKRYRVELSSESGDDRGLVVTDRQSGWRIFDWRGPIVNRLVEDGIVPRPERGPIVLYRDKAFVQHLALAAASTRMALDREAIPDRAGIARRRYSACELNCPLRARLTALGVALGAAHSRIARLLFEHPGHHFSQAEVFCLLELEDIPVRRSNVMRWLDELASLQVLQRIDAAPGRVFYDVDTRPHLHIFDETTGELRDAEVEGVIGASSSESVARFTISRGKRVHLAPATAIG